MSGINEKIIFGLLIFLFLALLCGGIILGIRLFEKNKPLEIDIYPAKLPDYRYEVNISGAVANPGIYPVKGDDTIGSIINTAKPMPDANPNSFSIQIHSNNETPVPQKINLNTANSWLLEVLPDIGPSRAQNIINYRQQNGLFKNILELLKVNGIGKTTFDKIKDLVTVED